MASGQCFTIEQDSGEICGCSFIYQFDVRGTGPSYAEIGTMRITANGNDLQDFLTRLHLMQIRLEDAEPQTVETFAVVSPNTASEYVLTTKSGLTRWSVPGVLALLRSQTGVPFDPAKYALHADQAAFEKALADLRAWHISGRRFRTSKGADVEVAMAWFDPVLLA